ncbi:MAG: HAMP domain-containing histidine kinase [Peptococcaceae bacterium]|nr:HAMP domain-containing histidine kinase [Peptococcaceae bacterium]
MSLRLKMTFLFSGVLALVLLIFSSVVYISMEKTLDTITKHAIEEIGEGVVRTTGILEKYPPYQDEVYLDLLADPDTYIQILDLDGTIIAQSGNMEGKVATLGQGFPPEMYHGGIFYSSINIEANRLYVYNRPLIVDGEAVGLLQIGQGMDLMDESLLALELLLCIGGGLALLCAGLLGWVLAGTALKPIKQIAEAAQAIRQGQDLKKQIDYTGHNDEVGYLAETLNHMMERLYKAYKDLEDAELSQRRFLTDISHELRTPITTIRGNAELLRKMGDNDRAIRTEALGDIISESERMTRMVSDLLALARADSGLRLELTQVDIEALLSEIYRQAAMLVTDTYFEERDISNIKGVIVKADADYLKRLFLILLQNAFNYAGSGEKVWIDCTVNEGWLEASVCDTGAGIEESEQQQIFQRFYRAGKKQGDGTGLGLSIAQWIAEQHGGSVGVQSKVGKGSVFTVRLPVHEGERVSGEA